MIKILQIMSNLKQNGTETFVMNVFRNIDKTKYRFDFLVISDEAVGFYKEIIALGAKVFFITPRRNGFIRYHKNLDKFFREHHNDYTVVHMHMGSLSSIAPLYYAKKYDIGTRIFHSHSSECTGMHNKLLHALNKFRIVNLATHYFACSEMARTWAYVGTKAYDKSQVITNGIELKKFRYNSEIRNRLRNELKVKDKFVIGHIGTFNEIKNHAFLIRLFKRIHTSHPESALILVGEGSLLNKSYELTKELGLEDSVLFLGRRNDVKDLLQAFDIFVMPSLFEGLPFTLIEAQASGLPIVTSTGVPIESKASESFESLDLTQDISIWVSHILTYIGFERYSPKESDPIYRFSITETITQIESAYNSHTNMLN